MTAATFETPHAIAERLARLREHLGRAGMDAAVVTRPEHLRYLAGLGSRVGPGLLVLTTDGGTLLVAEGDVPEGHALGDAAVTVAEYAWYDADRLSDSGFAFTPAARRVLDTSRLRRVAVEADHLPASLADVVAPADRDDLGPVMREWRAVKDDAEVTAIRHGAALLDRAFAAGRAAAVPGAREIDVLAAISAALAGMTSEPVTLECNVSSGERTTLPDPHASARRLEPGDLVLLDLYPAFDGYVADCARTFVVGPPSSRQSELHAVLESALAAAEQRLAPDVPVGDIAAAVRTTLADAGGYDTTMTHHVGHGIGLAAWEAPWIGRGDTRPLAAGNVVAIEPGLYLPDGGMRLEGNYVIGTSGAERLDSYPSGLLATPS